MLRFLAFCATVLAASSALDPVPAQRIKVFIFAGQSNMVGADTDPAAVDDFPAFVGAMGTQKDVRYAYSVGSSTSKGWTHLGQVDDDFGPELTFARKVKGAVDAPIAVIKCAVGGTTIASDWNPDAPPDGQQLYRRLVTLVESSLEDLEKPYDLEAVFWHQGENDMLNRELRDHYASGLRGFIARLREDLGEPQLDFFVGEVSDKGIWGMDHREPMRILRAQQREVAQSDPHVHWVPTSQLAFEVMGSGQPHYHFGTQGQLQHGEAYADAYLGEPQASRLFPTKGSPLESLEPGEPVHVFILAGQRNMEGEDSFAVELEKRAVRPRRGVLFRYSLAGGLRSSSDWEPLHPVGHLGNFGPELGFGDKLRGSMKGAIALIKVTDGAALLADWDPRGDDASRPVLAHAVDFIRQALDDLEKKGHPCKVEGVFWHHGENETYYGPFRERYGERLGRLISAMRADLELPDLTWFVAEQSPKSPWGADGVRAMNEQLRALAAADPLVRTVDTSDLPHRRIHFGTVGTLRLGERLAEAFLAP